MKVADIFKCFEGCNIPQLSDYSTLQRIETEDFFYLPPIQELNANENGKIMIISAPGAVGKTALAKYIAKNYNGIYWDVSKKVVGSTSFAGEIAHAVGVGHGALQDQVFNNLRKGSTLFILDSFDEAELISGRDGVKDFLVEIGGIMKEAEKASIIITARTETAKYIESVCNDENIAFSRYAIEYFDESRAFDFIVSYLKYMSVPITKYDEENIHNYLEEIRVRIADNTNRKAFLGYAQVLSIIARQVQVELQADQGESLRNLIQPNDNRQIISAIILHLIEREQKKLQNFKNRIREKYIKIGKESIVDSLYCKQEQLVRLQLFSLLDGDIESISISDYNACNELFPEDKEEYLALLKDWLPQHVFLRERTIMPIFSDYLLAESLLNEELVLFADEYKKQRRLPTRVFLDAYLSLNNGKVNCEHIYFLDLAFSSQTDTTNEAYCEISKNEDEDEDQYNAENLSLELTLTSNEQRNNQSISAKIIRDGDTPIRLSRANNMSVNVDGKIVFASSFQRNVVIRQSVIECDDLEFESKETYFETYNNEDNRLIIHRSLTKRPDGKIIIKGTKSLSVFVPPDKTDEYRGKIYEFGPYYKESFPDNCSDECPSIELFTYGLKKALEQFKTDKYEGDPGKFKEKIDARCHTGDKAIILEFLKQQGLIYEDGIMYKASLKKMDELRISRVAYLHFKFEQLETVYSIFREWFINKKANQTA